MQIQCVITSFIKNIFKYLCQDLCFLTTLVKMKTKSIITCPECGHKKEEEMPTEACQFFYECENCKTILKPKKGDCCVYCSYGSEKCPSVQKNCDCI